jgi:hypothetical protein
MYFLNETFQMDGPCLIQFNCYKMHSTTVLDILVCTNLYQLGSPEQSRTTGSVYPTPSLTSTIMKAIDKTDHRPVLRGNSILHQTTVMPMAAKVGWKIPGIRGE